MLVVANPGWITGQSYMITGPLACRVPAVLLEGSPIVPQITRFAEVIRRFDVTIFKAGSTFLRSVMSNQEAGPELKRVLHGSKLRICTFCAEPVSEAVQTFAMENIC